MTAIDNNVPVPEESTTKKITKRARKPKSEAKNTSTAGLIQALQFVSHAQKPIGPLYETHCIVNNGWVVGFDGVLTIGCKVEENISACPKTTTLLTALQKCTDALSITQLNEHYIAVKSAKYRATIPCVPFEDIPLSAPDEPIAVINDEVKKAFAILAPFATEGDLNAYRAGILLQAYSAVAMDSSLMLEYAHGIDLPPGLLIPKASAVAIAKAPKPLARFGFSQGSATFYFDDGSFIKTQLFKDGYPTYQNVFARFNLGNLTTPPPELFTAIEAVLPLSESGFVYLRGDKVQSHSSEDVGAVYNVGGIPQGMCFKGEKLLKVKEHFGQAVFDEAVKGVYFQQRNVIRGVLMGANE